MILVIGSLVFLGCPLRMIIRMSAGCGLAWCAPLTERERLTGIMAEKGIEQEEIHECMV